VGDSAGTKLYFPADFRWAISPGSLVKSFSFLNTPFILALSTVLLIYLISCKDDNVTPTRTERHLVQMPRAGAHIVDKDGHSLYFFPMVQTGNQTAHREAETVDLVLGVLPP
jgi:hypothetical protein